MNQSVTPVEDVVPGGEVPLLEVTGLTKHFPTGTSLLGKGKGAIRAVDGVSLEIGKGKTLGLVGESGCGKSTLARTILQLLKPTEGSVRFQGRELTELGTRQLRPMRRDMQMIFQDPYTSLNPRKRVGRIVGESLRIHGIAKGAELESKVKAILEKVGMSPLSYGRFPHEFSGGQRQRIGIARALASEPSLIIADEPVSALDVSIQAQIVNLMKDLQGELGLTYLFVAHDLGVVRQVSDEIAVMYLGKIVESGPSELVYESPIHPYTASLLSAVPIPDPKSNARRIRRPLTGDVPSPADPPSGCRFRTRCPRATDICARIEPPLVEFGGGQMAACHHPLGDRESPDVRTEEANGPDPR